MLGALRAVSHIYICCSPHWTDGEMGLRVLPKLHSGGGSVSLTQGGLTWESRPLGCTASSYLGENLSLWSPQISCLWPALVPGRGASATPLSHSHCLGCLSSLLPTIHRANTYLTCGAQ